MYLCGTTGLLAFFYTIYYGSIRHHGFLFMLFVASIWISHYSYQKTQILSVLNTPSKINPNIILTILVWVTFDWRLNGSLFGVQTFLLSRPINSQIYQRIQSRQNADCWSSPDDLTLEILGYLEKDQFYYPRTKRFGSYGTWDMKWRHGRSTPMNKVLQEVQRLSNKMDEDIIVITAPPLEKKSCRIFPMLKHL